MNSKLELQKVTAPCAAHVDVYLPSGIIVLWQDEGKPLHENIQYASTDGLTELGAAVILTGPKVVTMT